MSVSSEVDEIENLLHSLKEIQNTVAKQKIFIDFVLESATSKYNINEALTFKIRDIVTRAELKRSFLLANQDISESPLTLLGIKDFDDLELKYKEQNELKTALDRYIKDETTSLLKNLIDITHKNFQSLADVNVKSELETKRLGVKNKLIEKQEEYVKYLMTMTDILQECIELRFKIAPEKYATHFDSLGLSVTRHEIWLKLLVKKYQERVLSEKPYAKNAYKLLMKDIKAQQEDAKQQIDKLKQLIKKCESGEDIGNTEEALGDCLNSNYKLWVKNSLQNV